MFTYEYDRFSHFCPVYTKFPFLETNGTVPFANASNLHQEAPCAREVLAELANTTEGRDALNVSLDVNKFFPLLELPKWKYLASTDGFSAASRLDKVMLLGSVVLKQEGPRYAWW